jgi:hypothetical protein
MLAFRPEDGWKCKRGATAARQFYKWTSQQGKYIVKLHSYHMQRQKLRVTVFNDRIEIWRKIYSGTIRYEEVENDVRAVIFTNDERILSAKIFCLRIPYVWKDAIAKCCM